MTRGNLKTLIRLYVPPTKINRISDVTLNLIVQQAVDDISAKLNPLRTQSKFNVVASTYTYDLDTEVNRFLAILESGLWWNAGTAASTNWRQVYPKTIEWLDKDRPNWRDLNEGDPLYYDKDGGNLIIVPVPDASLTNGFWLYFSEKPIRMGDDAHYPFGYTSQIEWLAVLDDLIIKFAEWKLNQAIGKDQVATSKLNEYLVMTQEKKTIINKRFDISASPEAKFQGRRC